MAIYKQSVCSQVMWILEWMASQAYGKKQGKCNQLGPKFDHREEANRTDS